MMQWLPAILILPYFFVLLKIYRSLLKIKPFIIETNPSVFVSVIVACKNEENNLPVLLNCLTSQNYPKKLFEVIIVDDNSTDLTFEKANYFKEIDRIIVIHNNGKGKKQAIKTGINTSSGSLIITTDADCRMGNNWIGTIASFYEKNLPDLIICPVAIGSDGGFFGRFQELEFLSLQGITAGTAIDNNPTMCNGANLVFTKDAYLNHLENLHFEIPSGDDIFLLHSVKRDLNAKILWLESSSAIVTTIASPSLPSFLNQRSRWLSKGKVYKDIFTISLGIVTFVTILLHISYLVAGIFNPTLLWVLLAIFLLKSVPDFLILFNTSGRYNKRGLMHWFIPSQIFYPIYVLVVACYSLKSVLEVDTAKHKKRKIH
jgi:glycosyltransferase involved in cell wall biosynthesis